MSTDGKIGDAQARLLAAQSELEQTFTQLRFLLMQAAEEIKAQREQASNTRLENFTEAEAAEVLRISETTLRRLRQADPNFPHWRAGDLVRYTNFDLIEITEILRTRKGGRKGKRGALREAS
jgi:hypothetical protein